MPSMRHSSAMLPLKVTREIYEMGLVGVKGQIISHGYGHKMCLVGVRALRLAASLTKEPASFLSDKEHNRIEYLFPNYNVCQPLIEQTALSDSPN